MEWYLKTYPCWLCAKWFEVLEKSLCGINVKVSGRVQGKVSILRNCLKNAIFPLSNTERKEKPSS